MSKQASEIVDLQAPENVHDKWSMEYVECVCVVGFSYLKYKISDTVYHVS